MKKFLCVFAFWALGASLSAQEVLLPKVFVNGTQVLGSAYTNYGPGTVQMSGYNGGRIYYTTNGAAPSILSAEYTGPIPLTNDFRLRAIAFSADFTQSSSRTVDFVVEPLYYIRFSGNGNYAEYSIDGGPFKPVYLEPNQLIYIGSGRLLTLRAIDQGGWFFDRWRGEHSSTQRTISFTATKSEEVHLTLYRTNRLDEILANGRVEASPAPPYSSDDNRVEISAIPNAGFGFVGWSNSDAPITYSQQADAPRKIPQFAPLPENGYSLSVQIDGHGLLTSPSKFIYSAGEVANLGIVPEVGWILDHWSGDLSGSNATPNLVMNGNKSVVAHLKKMLKWSPTFRVVRGAPAVGVDGSVLAIDGQGLRAYNSEGFTKWEAQLAVRNDPGISANSPPVVGPDGTIYVYGSQPTAVAFQEVAYLQAFSSGGRLLWQRSFSNEGANSLALGENGLYLAFASCTSSGCAMGLRLVSLRGETLAEASGVGIDVAVDKIGNVRSEQYFSGNGAQWGEEALVALTTDLAPLWSLSRDQSGIGRLAIDLDGRTFFTRPRLFTNNGMTSIDYHFGGATSDGQRFWEDYESGGYRPGIWSSLGANRVFMNDQQTFAAIDSTTSATVWSRGNWPAEAFRHSVAAADGSVFAVTLRYPPPNQSIFLQKLSTSGEVVWEVKVNSPEGNLSPSGHPPGTTYPIIGPDGMLYISGDTLSAFDVGTGPAVSGWPMQRADWRNTGKAFTGTLAQPKKDELHAQLLAAGGSVLEFTPSQEGTFQLQSSPKPRAVVNCPNVLRPA